MSETHKPLSTVADATTAAEASTETEPGWAFVIDRKSGTPGWVAIPSLQVKKDATRSTVVELERWVLADGQEWILHRVIYSKASALRWMRDATDAAKRRQTLECVSTPGPSLADALDEELRTTMTGPDIFVVYAPDAGDSKDLVVWYPTNLVDSIELSSGPRKTIIKIGSLVKSEQWDLFDNTATAPWLKSVLGIAQDASLIQAKMVRAMRLMQLKQLFV
jgi:hypothetical protein